MRQIHSKLKKIFELARKQYHRCSDAHASVAFNSQPKKKTHTQTQQKSLQKTNVAHMPT